MSYYILSSNDHKVFRITAKAVEHSKIISETIADNEIPADSDHSLLQRMSGSILNRIITWCQRHEPGKVPLEISVWDRNHLKLFNRREMMNLILAASTLQIDDLVRMTIQLFCESEKSVESEVIRFHSKEEDDHQLSVEAAEQSAVFSKILEHLGNSPALIIPIDIETVHLDIVIKWCEHHKGEPIPEICDDPTNVIVPEFDKKLLDHLGNEDIMKIMDAANSLDIRGLQRSAIKTYSDMASGFSQEQLAALFL